MDLIYFQYLTHVLSRHVHSTLERLSIVVRIIIRICRRKYHGREGDSHRKLSVIFFGNFGKESLRTSSTNLKRGEKE